MCVWLEGCKSRRWKTFLFDWRKKGEDEKCILNKLTIIFLLYSNGIVRGVGKCNKVGVFM